MLLCVKGEANISEAQTDLNFYFFTELFTKKSRLKPKYSTAVSHSRDLCCRSQQNRPCVGG